MVYALSINLYFLGTGDFCKITTVFYGVFPSFPPWTEQHLAG